jgi:ABC-type glycerol-3-phosphate transport system permease component
VDARQHHHHLPGRAQQRAPGSCARRPGWTVYLRDGSLFTLPRGLKGILDQLGQGGEGQWEVVLAASVIATVPMPVIFFLGQRYFVEGIATTGRKG